MLDLSVLDNYGIDLCVRCLSEEDTLEFLKEIKEQYRERCEQWPGHYNPWGIYDTGHVDFFPNETNLSWDGQDWAESHNCPILAFEDIPRKDFDLGDICASELTIDELFG